jgi:hypothetical protein
MAQKWNLQDIRPIENRSRPFRPSAVEITRTKPPVEVSDPADIEPVVIQDGNRTKKFRYAVIGGIVLFFLTGSFALSLFLAETTVTVQPIFRDPNVNAEFEAFKERRDNALTYVVLKLDATAEKQVKASGQKQVEEQARGVIEIFKTTPGAERLIKNTRFKSPEGLIFRIEESVVVPGAIEKDGKLNPGSIRAEVFADTIGEEYNLAANTRFSIPGFEENKLTDLFTAMYATNPEPFTGGFNGPQFIVDNTELSTSSQALELELRNKLLERIKNEQPSGFVSFEGSYAFTYTDLPTVSHGADLVTIRKQAVLQVPLFESGHLASFLAAQTVPTYNGNPVRIDSYDGMLFRYSDPTHNSTAIDSLPSLLFTLTGKPRIIWEFNDKQLQKDLAGKPKTALETVRDGYADAVESFTVSMKPFYRQSFPENGEEIKIIEVLQEPE